MGDILRDVNAAIAHHLFSGQLFFTAATLFVFGLAGGRRTRILPLLAIPLALLSGTPMPLFVAIPLLAVAIAGAFLDRTPVKIAAAAVVVFAAAFEVPHHRSPRPIPKPARLIVIGDSLSSGGFGEGTPWPNRVGVGEIVNLSRPSDTAADALDVLDALPPVREGDLAIIEIGGNDMLDRVPPGEFERALDSILRRLEPRPIVVLELPVMPGGWAHAAAQRRVARRHNAIVIPKRVLSRVLTTTGNTDDGLHLTDRGHEALARAVQNELGWNVSGESKPKRAS